MFRWLEKLLCKIFDLVREEDYKKLKQELEETNKYLEESEKTIQEKILEINKLNIEIESLLEKLEELEDKDIEYKVTFKSNPDVTFYVNDEEVKIDSSEESKALKYKKGTRLKVYAKANDPEEQDKIKLYIEEDKQ